MLWDWGHRRGPFGGRLVGMDHHARRHRRPSPLLAPTQRGHAGRFPDRAARAYTQSRKEFHHAELGAGVEEDVSEDTVEGMVMALGAARAA